MESRSTIEQRKATSEPLVEIIVNPDGTDGAFAPTGRRFHSFEDGRDSYGLTDAEDCAFSLAEARLAASSGRSIDQTERRTHDESIAIETARATDPSVDVERVVAEYRAAHPLPTSFASLPDGDPCSNYAADDVPLVVRTENSASTVSEVLPASAPVVIGAGGGEGGATSKTFSPLASTPSVPFAVGSGSAGAAAPVVTDLSTGEPVEYVQGESIPGVPHVVVPVATMQQHASKLREFVTLIKRDFTVGGHHALEGIERIAHELASLV